MTALIASPHMAARAVGAILRRDGGMLLGRRSPHRSYANCWDVIGGHVEPGESLGQALARELEEEIGVTLTDAVPLTTIGFEDGAKLLQLFVVEQWQGTPIISDSEHTELSWFAPTAASRLPDLALPAYRSIFASLYAPPQ